MKNVQIKALTAENFKGLHSTFEANGQNVDILGDNATGKTTTADAISWVLFDKDSQNKGKFAIKTLNEDGSEQHNGEHTVEMVLLVDELEVKLKKTYREKWTKKRGAAEKVFEGNETKYWIDDVPSKKGEYTAKVAEIIDEDTFKLLTNPLYFSEILPWESRRLLLMKLGAVTDEDVVTENPKLAELMFALSGRSFDDFKKITTAKKKEINSELKEVPVRISELQKQCTFAGDTAPLKAKIAELDKEIEVLNEQISNIKNGGAIADKKVLLAEKRAELTTYQADFKAKANEDVYKLQARTQEEQTNLLIMQRPLNGLHEQVALLESAIADSKAKETTLKAEKAEMLQKYHSERAVEFVYEESCTCPTCKQDLPQEQLEAARTKALEDFNLAKSKKLAELVHTGKQIAGEIANEEVKQNDALLKINELKADIEEAEKALAKKKEEVAKFEKELATKQAAAPVLEDDEQYQKMVAEGTTLGNEIKSLEEHANEAITDVEKQKQAITAQRSELSAEVAQMGNAEVLKARITELEQRETELANEYGKIEAQLFQIEEFMKVKCELLEEKINSHFELVTFKLFDTQVNGAIIETCEVLVNGVPFSTGLNNAARINAGIDIINTLSKHHEVSAPIVIDNAEAVTKLIDTDAQVIRLIVSAADKTLRVVTNKQLSEVI